MNKVVKRVVIVSCSLFVFAAMAIVIFEYLLSHGHFTQYIKDKINEQIGDGELSVGSIYLEMFSGIVLNDVNFKGIGDLAGVRFRCKALTVNGNLMNLIKSRVEKIEIENAYIDLNPEKIGSFSTGSAVSQTSDDAIFNLQSMLPEGFFINEVFISKMRGRVTTSDYVLELAEINITLSQVQSERPFDVSINGDLTVTNRLNNESASLLVKLGLNTSYDLVKDELIVRENSHLSLKNMGVFNMKGKICSVMSDPEIGFNVHTESFAINGLPKFLKDFDFADISPLALSGFCDLDIVVSGKMGKLEIKTKGVARDLKVEYKGWSCDGNVSVDAVVDTHDFGSPEEITMLTNISFTGVKFASPGYDYFGESLNGNIDLEVNTDYDFKQIDLKADVKINPFFVSLGDFSTDMRNRSIRLSLEAGFDAGKDLLSDIKLDLLVDDLGTFIVNGNVSDVSGNPRFNIGLQMTEMSNAAFFDTFVKDSFEYSSPSIFNASIKGVSNAKFEINGVPDNIQITGNLKVNDGYIEIGDVSIEGLYIDFPISMTYPGSGTSISKDKVSGLKYGDIKIKRLSYDFLEINNLEINPIVKNNNFFIKEAINIPIFGGSIFVEDIFVEDIINPESKVNFSFKLEDIDLKELSLAWGLTPFEGTINTSLLAFRQQGDNLTSDGEMRFTLFGGDIVVNDLMLTDFKTSLMEIGFSAKVNHLDLGKMSNTFKDWGNVSGIINGRMDDFKIVAGEPSSFEVEFKTQKTKGVKQVVSANFLKSFVPGIANVLNAFRFTSYGYKVIGLSAKLENDYINFKGAIRDDGRELFMKGSGLKKLDIVFNNVDKKIKFSSFLGSFKSIMKSDFDETRLELK